MVLLRIGAWLVALPYLLTLALVMTGAPTWSGVAYLLAMGLLLGGLMTLPVERGAERKVFGKKWPRGLSRAGLVGIFAIMFVRCCTAGGSESLRMATSPRLVDRLVDERDIALSGTRVLSAGGMLQDDRAELPGAMRDAYQRMAAVEGDVPSPVAATYLGLQRPSAYDMLLIGGEPKPANAVVFLHGYGGNFTLPSWQVAEALEGLDVLTACPSTHFVGEWDSEPGEAIVRDVVKELHARGITRIVLAGLSNGGYGASLLATRLRGSFVGLVLVSGATPSAGDAGVPVLLIHGHKDGMASYGESVSYRASHARSKLVTLDAGHFAMLVRSKEANQALRDFVVQVTGGGALTARRSP
jgi:pimeloyl-ACP methyl ester carboxylesterase